MTEMPAEEAAMIAADESLETDMAIRKLLALLIAEIGFIGNVLISIDEKLEGPTRTGGKSVH